MNRRYIHQLPGWPSLSWNEAAVAQSLAAVRHAQGRLVGKLESLPESLRQRAMQTALELDVVKTSAIEGERLDPLQVRSSLARQLGLSTVGLPRPTRHVDGIVEMTLDATRRNAEPLTADRLHGWHSALFPSGRSGMVPIDTGRWRTDAKGPMRVVSGPIGRERVHLEAPAAARLEREMRAFLRWFESPQPLDPVLRAAVAHLWFVTVHPYQDGNGRIGRAISDLALARGDGLRERYYGMSAQIEAERADYYAELETAQCGTLDVTRWVAWFVGCLGRSLERAEEALEGVRFRAAVADRLASAGDAVNARQRTVLDRLLGPFEGHLTSAKYAKLAKCSADTALRDMTQLVELGLLVRNPAGGRSTSYRLCSPQELAERAERRGGKRGRR